MSTARFWNKFHQVHSDLLISHIKNESFICSRETNRVVLHEYIHKQRIHEEVGMSFRIYLRSQRTPRKGWGFKYIYIILGIIAHRCLNFLFIIYKARLGRVVLHVYLHKRRSLGYKSRTGDVCWLWEIYIPCAKYCFRKKDVNTTPCSLHINKLI